MLYFALSQALRKSFTLCLLITLLCVANGCGKTKMPRLPTTPVKGALTVAGQPKAKVQLRFHPKVPFAEPSGKILAPMATTDEQGNFVPSTYDSFDGLPPGEYTITASFPSLKIDQGEEIAGPDQWQGRYNSLQNPLKVITVGTEPLELPKIDVK